MMDDMDFVVIEINFVIEWFRLWFMLVFVDLRFDYDSMVEGRGIIVFYFVFCDCFFLFGIIMVVIGVVRVIIIIIMWVIGVVREIMMGDNNGRGIRVIIIIVD